MNKLGRDKLDWDKSLWDQIDMGVDAEAKQTKVAAQFLPSFQSQMATKRTIQSDTVASQTASRLTINEVDEIPIIEIWTDFALTQSQYEQEKESMTAVTLAMNAVNKLSRAEDILIFRGNAGLDDDLFQNQTVHLRGSQRNKQSKKIESGFTIVGLLPSAPPGAGYPRLSDRS